MNEVISLKEYILKNNLLNKHRVLSSCYKETELFNGILTEEVLDKFKDYIFIGEFEWFNDTYNIIIKPINSSKFIFTQKNKQPLNSRAKYFECFVPDLADAINMFRSRHSEIWKYKDFEVYKDNLNNFVTDVLRGFCHKFTKAERNKDKLIYN